MRCLLLGGLCYIELVDKSFQGCVSLIIHDFMWWLLPPYAAIKPAEAPTEITLIEKDKLRTSKSLLPKLKKKN